ncbi:MAG: class I SAM-dependent rRNA methyltransferase [Candidatus Zixiibacteriota bacterium]
MSTIHKIILKRGKELSVQLGHPWIFSGAIDSIDGAIQAGDVVSICRDDGEAIATGTFSKRAGIAARIFSFTHTHIDSEFVCRRIRDAHERRLQLGYGPATTYTGYRVVFGESDGLPGIIVDRYDDVFVLQLGHVGAEKLRGTIVDALSALFSPRAIIERSDLPSRKEDGLTDVVGVLAGADPGAVKFSEGDLTLIAYPLTGQKTGFFLDQRLLRAAVTRYAYHARVLNLFSYSGAFGMAALAGSARHVTNVDSSESALALSKELLHANNCDESATDSVCADVFQWLSACGDDQYEMVIVDPPALIKRRSDLDRGRKAYHFLYRAAIRLVRDNGYVVVSSCSMFFTQDDMIKTLRRASAQVGATVEILEFVNQPPDHPVLSSFPESWYLKSAICRVLRGR